MTTFIKKIRRFRSICGNKIDQINSSLANSSLDTDNKEKQMKKVDSRKILCNLYELIFMKSRFGLILGGTGGANELKILRTHVFLYFIINIHFVYELNTIKYSLTLLAPEFTSL